MSTLGIWASRASRRAVIIAAATAALSIGVVPLMAAATSPAATVIDFRAAGYTTGFHSPATQNGWWMAKSVDFSLVENSDFVDSGLPADGRSLQFSNATHQSGGAHLVSPGIAAAGEPSTGAVGNTFETTFTVASATGDIQPGLGVDVALDGASRFGGVVNLRHTEGGLSIGSYWMPAGAPDESLASWRSAVFTTVDATVPHVIRAVAVFLEGEADILRVYVDGQLVSGGTGATTWEAFSGSNGGDRSVDSLSFKTTSSAPAIDGIGYQSGLPAAPATSGKGFLFAGISYGVTTTTPEPTPSPTPTPSDTPTPPAPPAPPAPPKKPAATAPAEEAAPTAAEAAPITLATILEEFGSDTAELLATYLAETGRSVPPDVAELFVVQGELDLSDFRAWLDWTGDETVQLYGYSTPTYLGAFPVVDGRVGISGVDLAALGEGTHHLLVVGEQSGRFEVAEFSVEAASLPSTEQEPPTAAPADIAPDGAFPLWAMAVIAAVALAAVIGTAVLLRRRFA